MTNSPPTGSLLWLDLTTADAESLRDFYTAVVGWRVDRTPMGDYDDFTMVAANGTAVAGVCHARGSNADIPPQWLNYVAVDNAKTAAERTKTAGGSVVVDPRPLAGGEFCVIRDPAGAVLALFTPASASGSPRLLRVDAIGDSDVERLPVRDVDAAIGYYRCVLGFEVLTRSSKSARLQRDGVEIGIAVTQQDPTDASCYFEVDNLDALHADLTAKGIAPTAPRVDRQGEENYRVFFAREPYGVCFCFGHRTDDPLA